MNTPPERHVVRLRFWPLWVRLNVALQLGGVVLFLVIASLRWVGGTPILRPGEPPYFLLQPMVVTGLGTIIASVLWRMYGPVLTHRGVEWVSPSEGKDWAFEWGELSQVERGFELVAGRCWHLSAPRGKGLRLPVRPADLIGFRDAVERFAGPDHPLTLAMTEVADL